MTAMRGDLGGARRYATWLALTRALKGLDAVAASFERGALAGVWASAGILFREPVACYTTAGRRALIVLRPSFDPAVLLRVPLQQLYACMHLQLERYLATERSRGACGHILIVDLFHFGYRHLHRRFLTTVVQLIGSLIKHAPELVHKLYLVNAPSFFKLAWAAILPFTSEYVQAKICITRSDNRDELLALVGAEGLPAEFGGALPSIEAAAAAHDPSPDEDAGAAWQTVEVEAGRTASVNLQVTARDVAAAAAPAAAEEEGGGEDGATEPTGAAAERGLSIVVEFSLEGSCQDISFFTVVEPPRDSDTAAAKRAAAAEQAYVIEPVALAADELPYSRILENVPAGSYTCVWDNSAAWRYPRTVKYRVHKIRGGIAGMHGTAGGQLAGTPGGPPEWEGLSEADLARLARPVTPPC